MPVVGRLAETAATRSDNIVKMIKPRNTQKTRKGNWDGFGI